MKSFRALSICFLLGSTATFASGSDKVSARLYDALAKSGVNDPVMAWVFFTDKGSSESLRDNVPLNVVSERSLQRRRKVLAENELVDYSDLPVEQTYIDRLAQHVLWVKQRTKWFNGASVIATKAQLEEVQTLPFVSSLDLVYRAKGTRELEQEVSAPTEINPAQGNTEDQIHVLNYGASLAQNQQINIPAVHNTGNYAQGVIVGSFDNGYRLLTHQAFDTLRPKIIATYDYVDHKVSVVPNNPSTSFGSHGVNTLSTIAGYRDGQLIGPAWGATIILARTENDSSETPIEEDNWAAAIEWADSIGVDVTTTSLGYNTYDPPYTSWTWQNMDGNTTLITRAADRAVSRGIVVCNSAGNDGYNASHNTLGAPADGDSVISVGAVDPSGTISSFSSCGPTTSTPPRTKPDVCAQGSSVRVASSTNTSGYGYSQGTSFSCPLTAGVAALIVKARPYATPVQIANAMRSTASRASTPDNRYGWGIVNALAAINALPATGVGEGSNHPGEIHLDQNYPNPFNPTTSISYTLPEDGVVTVKVFDALGREVKTLISGSQTSKTYRVTWDGKDASGIPVASGMYLYRLSATGASGKVYVESKRMMLLK